MRRTFLIAAGFALLLALALWLMPEQSPPGAAQAQGPPAVLAAIEPAAPRPQSVAEIDKAPAELPTVDVKPRAVHTVPDTDAAPARPVTLKGRDGRDITPRAPQVAARPAPAPPRGPGPAFTISGAARVGDVVSLSVRGRAVPLFGVKPPRAGDRCTVGAGLAPRDCGDVARQALAARLGANANVSCRVPPGQRGAGAAAICLDSLGVDLGGYLIAEGFALADAAQSYDYLGAEGVARSLRRGLWRYR